MGARFAMEGASVILSTQPSPSVHAADAELDSEYMLKRMNRIFLHDGARSSRHAAVGNSRHNFTTPDCGSQRATER